MSDQEKKVFTPSEVAKMFGISVQSLKYHRLRGHIEGTDVGNTTIYTQEQINAANLTPEKPGPKTSKQADKQKKQNGQNEEPSIGDAYGTFREKHVLVGLAS